MHNFNLIFLFIYLLRDLEDFWEVNIVLSFVYNITKIISLELFKDEVTQLSLVAYFELVLIEINFLNQIFIKRYEDYSTVWYF